MLLWQRRLVSDTVISSNSMPFMERKLEEVGNTIGPMPKDNAHGRNLSIYDLLRNAKETIENVERRQARDSGKINEIGEICSDHKNLIEESESRYHDKNDELKFHLDAQYDRFGAIKSGMDEAKELMQELLTLQRMQIQYILDHENSNEKKGADR
jgi:hypothetical protein